MRHPLPTTIDMPTQAPILTLSNGTTVELGEKIGDGGMAVVYACMVHGKRAAAKILKAQSDDEGNRDLQIRFHMEAERLHFVKADHMPRVLDTGIVEVDPCIVMERVEGACLKEIIDYMPDRRIPGDILRHVAYGCASVLGDVHAKGIVHKDVKTNNFMLGRSRSCPKMFTSWLLDLGLSARTADKGEEADDRIRGTPNYMDPLSMFDGGYHYPQSDIFGLGITFHEALRGRLPWTNEQRKWIFNDPERMTGLFNITLQPTTRAERPWMDLIGTMLRHNRGYRPTCPEICERLKAMGANVRGGIDLHINDAPEADTLARAIHQTHAASRRKFRWLLGSAAVTLLLGTLAVPLMTDRAAHTPPKNPAPPVKTPEKAPALSPALQAALAKAKTAPNMFMQSAEMSHIAHAFSLTTEELCILLEEGKPGASAGLPKRAQYPAYLYRSQPDSQDEESLLQLTRGCFHVHGQNATFHSATQPGETVRTFLEPWKRLDTAADAKELRTINDRLRELRKAAGVK